MGLADQLWQGMIVAEERGRLEQYARAWQVYFGKHPKPLKVKEGQPDDNVTVNFARLIVDVGVSFLFGAEPQFDLDSDSSETTPAEGWLNECWRANRKSQLLQKLAMNGGVCGHVFVKIALPRTGGLYPRLINLSPEYVQVICNPDDIDEVWRYLIQYPAVGRNGERLVKRQTIEQNDSGRWMTVDHVSRNGGRFETEQESIWPYAWPPIVDCQNLPSPNEYYGIADIEEDVLALNQAINFTLSNLQRIIRYHAHPKTWGRGFKAKELEIGVDGVIALPGDGELHNLEMTNDLSSSIEYYKRIREALHETAQVPEVATGKVEDVGQLSGVALQLLYGPLVRKTEQKRLTYGEMLVELNRRLLEMGRYGGQISAIYWPELLPRNAMEERQAALLDHQLGVSQDTLLRQLGYNPDAEREKSRLSETDMAERMLTAFDRGDNA